MYLFQLLQLLIEKRKVIWGDTGEHDREEAPPQSQTARQDDPQTQSFGGRKRKRIEASDHNR